MRDLGAVKVTKLILLPSLLFSSALVLLAIARYIDSGLALKGSYVLVGILLASFVYYIPGQVSLSNFIKRFPIILEEYSFKIFFICFLLHIPLLLFWDNLISLAFIQLIGSFLIIYQIFRNENEHILLFQTIVLYTSLPINKYLTTGFFFGNMDTIHHVRFINELISTGTISGIQNRYEFWPGYHLIMSFGQLILDIPPYDIIIIIGTFVFSFSILFILLMFRTITLNPYLSIIIAISYSSFTQIAWFAAYFYPTALWFALFILFLYTVFFYRYTYKKTSHSIIALVILMSLLSIHHLSFILAWSVLLTLIIANYYKRNTFNYSIKINRIPIYLICILPFAHWITYGNEFIMAFISASSTELLAIFSPIISESTSSGPSVVQWGTVHYSSIWTIITINRVYQSALIAMLIIGFISFFELKIETNRLLPVFFTGAIGALILVDIPHGIESLDRLRLPWILFTCSIVGFGFYRMLKNGTINVNKTIIGVVVLIFLLSGTLAGAAHISSLHGPDSFDRSLEKGEYEKLELAGNFAGNNSQNIMTFQVSEYVLEDNPAIVNSPWVSQDELTYESNLFLYRNAWADNPVRHQGDNQPSRIVISESWLDQLIYSENQVYTNGDIGLLFSREETRS